MKQVLVCGTPTTVSRILIKNIAAKQKVDFIGYQDIRQYEQIKRLCNRSFIINKTIGSTENKLQNFFIIIFQKYTEGVIFGNRNIINAVFLIIFKIKKMQIVYFPYDLSHKFLGRFCYTFSDKILLKGEANLKRKYKIYNKLIEKEDLIDKQSTIDKNKIHLVFIGGVFDGNLAIFRQILKDDRFIVHIYPSNPNFLEGVVNDKIIVYNYIKNHKLLVKNISRYDFGLIIIDTVLYKNVKSSSTMKLFDYLSAGLPIIINTEYENMAKIVNDNGFGIVFKDVNRLNIDIKNCDYNKLIDCVRVNRKKFYADVNVLGEKTKCI